LAILSTSTKPQFRNEILAALPSAEIDGLRPLLSRVRWISGQALHEPSERIEQVFFVEQGFGSMVAEADDGNSRIEVGLIGRESMIGLPALLDPEATSFHRVMVQMTGVAHRLPSQALRDSAAVMPVLRKLLFRALQASMAQVAQTAACNSRHTLTERLARWMLMAHDRADGNELPLTQEFLSIMLAVRRSGVTVAIASLQTAGLIRHSRGRIRIVDRPGLEAAACECYGLVQAFTAALAARSL
jgi:CRP-like cAMP-binding protein